jgi:hypothetical protein
VSLDEIRAAPPKDIAQRDADDDHVVDVASNRNEVGDEVEWHEEVGDQRRQDELPAPANARIAKESLEEDDAVGHEGGRRLCFLPAAGDDEDDDEARIGGDEYPARDGDSLPDSQLRPPL